MPSIRRNKAAPTPAETDLENRCDAAEQIGQDGDTDEAIRLFGDIALDSMEELGQEHPRTLIALQRRAHWTIRAGRPANAVAPSERLIADMTRVLGPMHLQTLITRRIHAECVALAGDPDRAGDLLDELIAESARPLKHSGERSLQLEARRMCETLPRTTRAPQNKPPDRREQPRNTEPPTPPRESTVTPEQDFPPNPQTHHEPPPPRPPRPSRPSEVPQPSEPAAFAQRYADGLAMGQEGNPAAAAEAFAILVADVTAVLGHDHTDTLACRAEYATWLGMSGAAAKAARILSDVAESCARIHGDDHPDTIVARAELEHWQSVANN